jgi:hypothetical protein
MIAFANDVSYAVAMARAANTISDKRGTSLVPRTSS